MKHELDQKSTWIKIKATFYGTAITAHFHLEFFWNVEVKVFKQKCTDDFNSMTVDFSTVLLLKSHCCRARCNHRYPSMVHDVILVP